MPQEHNMYNSETEGSSWVLSLSEEGAPQPFATPPPMPGHWSSALGLGAKCLQFSGHVGSITGRQKSLDQGLLLSLPFMTVLATLDKAAKLDSCLGLSFPSMKRGS